MLVTKIMYENVVQTGRDQLQVENMGDRKENVLKIVFQFQILLHAVALVCSQDLLGFIYQQNKHIVDVLIIFC